MNSSLIKSAFALSMLGVFTNDVNCHKLSRKHHHHDHTYLQQRSQGIFSKMIEIEESKAKEENDRHEATLRK